MRIRGAIQTVNILYYIVFLSAFAQAHHFVLTLSTLPDVIHVCLCTCVLMWPTLPHESINNSLAERCEWNPIQYELNLFIFRFNACKCDTTQLMKFEYFVFHNPLRCIVICDSRIIVCLSEPLCGDVRWISSKFDFVCYSRQRQIASHDSGNNWI